MRKTVLALLLLSIFSFTCEDRSQKYSKAELSEMTAKANLIIVQIQNSDIYEDPNNWESRGLNSSNQTIILILRKATNEFLDQLKTINNSNLTTSQKRKQIKKNVNKLPWNQLDTEEKEFLADVIAPAIEASGFNPWSII